ncbi:hypothetical protein M0811_04184 [Anaeramoeba ignava]|uniref:BTB domain-containing protein n=1 Tax=Anaeramoeba ignava TaxID=1746090 RepID=A0A9Q0RGA4_ANAIG|nr:hypothetical protein M0811_04184 [Anaeramoeba ignava]
MTNNFNWGWTSNLSKNKSERKFWIPKSFSIFPGGFIKNIRSNLLSDCFLGFDDQMIICGELTEKNYFEMSPKIKFKKISSGITTFIGLTEENVVYFWGEDLCIQEKSLGKKTFQKLVQFPNGGVIDIVCGIGDYYIVDEKGILFHFGITEFSSIEDLEYKHILTWKPIFKNVKRVFSGQDSHHYLVITNDNKIYAAGENQNGQLGTNSFESTSIAKLVPFPYEKVQIIDIQCGSQFSLILAKEKGFGQVYTTNFNDTRLIKDLEDRICSFTKIPEFLEENIIQISSGSSHSLALNELNEIFVWGNNSNYQLAQESPFTSFDSPQKLIIQDLNYENHLIVYSGLLNSYVFSHPHKPLIIDMLNLFQREDCCDDLVFFEDGKKSIHSLIFLMRIGKDRSILLKDDLKKIDKKNGEKIVKWIYSGILTRDIWELLIKVGFNEEEIYAKSHYKGIQQDLQNLYFDNETKDFSIISQDKDIRAHKVILIARSELFRGMFINVQDSSNKVHDYTNSKFQSIQSLIEYFYTDSFPNDLEDEIIQELSTFDDFFQLNSFKNFQKQLKIKKVNQTIK